jgi:hypothetical protein
MIIACAVFASRLPKAIAEDGGGCIKGPCDSFSGSFDFTNPAADKQKYPGKALLVWGPAGWICGIIAIPFYLYVICCAFSRTIDQNRPLLGGQTGVYQVEGTNYNQNYQPLTNAGGTYVPPQMPQNPHQM